MNTEQPSNSFREASDLPILVSMGSAPQTFGMSRSYIYELAAQGKISLKKMGRYTMVVTESMLAYINALPNMTPVTRKKKPSA
ncbi:hypothetical protein OQ496_03320 [Acetobacter suratthaniensis]|uniref:Helix-turn-helix domain-containing protein n=1 Tax=Acetobacter suratthaniensis TaxID=1502841 RepID=A0ABS3LIN5_9PROT|nr:hypothetical protein [Acetobacter suratthaniensis]MBO1326907.1 hypothetical protein [Acetobacter suratthaniensis]MCX2565486.1 hypothetical protein [Acetobacter suratthaniensis]